MTPHPIHTTLIQTEGPHRVTVEPSDDGRWFRVLNWLTQSGIWAALPANQKAVLIPLHQHRSPNGLVLAPLSVIGQEAGLGRSATYDAIQGLLAHPAGLLARQGIALAVLPDRLFVGRPPPSATADTPVRNGGQFSATADTRHLAVRAHAPSQPEEEPEELAWAKRGITPEATKRYMDARGRGMAGWTGYPVHWDLEGVTCPRLALGMLDLREPRRQQVLDLCPDLTVEEIVRTFDQIRMGTNVKNPPMVLAHRLLKQRGRQLPKAAPVHDREALDFARAMEALRAGRRA